MPMQITTSQLDISYALDAYKALESGDYQKAAVRLHEIVDTEPGNWMARFYLAVCYYLSGGRFTALQAFKQIGEQCPEQDIKVKAREAMKALAVEMGKAKLKPAEHNLCVSTPFILKRLELAYLL